MSYLVYVKFYHVVFRVSPRMRLFIFLCLYFIFLLGNFPLAIAASNGHVDVIELLFDYGAELEEVDTHSMLIYMNMRALKHIRLVFLTRTLRNA